MSDSIRTDRRPWLIIAALAIVTIIVYCHLFTNDFTNFDDDMYITHNFWVKQGLSADSIRWAFGFTDKDGTYWQPLTWLSLMLDYELFALDPAGYHLENLLLHIACAVTLFLVLRGMTGALWRPALVAALFALHPLNVENVAWAAERKSILSALFFLLALMAYTRYVRHPSVMRYLPVFLAMATGLMAKSMIVTLPFVLLLIDFWPLQRMRINAIISSPVDRISFGRLLLEKTPLMALSLASVMISVYSLKADPLHTVRTYLPPLGIRVSEALVSYVKYLGKLAWPTDLAPYYPPHYGYPVWQVFGAILLLSALTLLTIRYSRKTPWLVVGWLWYLGMLLPVSGLMRSGLWPAMADRFAYLPFIGLFIALAWSLPSPACSAGRQRLMVVLACAVLIGMGVRTWQQAALWKTSRTLFSHSLKVADDNFVARNNYGHGLLLQGRGFEAAEQFRKALKFRPDYAKSHFNLGTALDMQNEPEEAKKEYLETLRLDPEFSDAHINLGQYYGAKGEFDEARKHFEAAHKRRPHDPTLLHNIGVNYIRMGHPEKAERYLRDAVNGNPSYVNARMRLGEVLEGKGEREEAAVQYRAVLKLVPNNPDALKRLMELGY